MRRRRQCSQKEPARPRCSVIVFSRVIGCTRHWLISHQVNLGASSRFPRARVLFPRVCRTVAAPWGETPRVAHSSAARGAAGSLLS